MGSQTVTQTGKAMGITAMNTGVNVASCAEGGGDEVAHVGTRMNGDGGRRVCFSANAEAGEADWDRGMQRRNRHLANQTDVGKGAGASGRGRVCCSGSDGSMDTETPRAITMMTKLVCTSVRRCVADWTSPLT